MKGVVFVELIRMAESVMGEDVVDEILDKADLESDGAFSTVGNYPCKELLTLVDAFGEHLGAPVEALHTQFGHWMFARFVDGYPAFFEGKSDGFDMLEAIESEVHVEVRKLYPEAELPTFATDRPEEGQLRMVYSSERPLHHFCGGMIEACMAHFNQPVDVVLREDHSEGRFRAEFTVCKTAQQAA